MKKKIASRCFFIKKNIPLLSLILTTNKMTDLSSLGQKSNDCYLEKYTKRNYFFIKNVSWSRLNNEKIFIHLAKEEKIVLRPWAQQIFLDADGKTRIKDYFANLAKDFIKHENKLPKNLEKHFIENMESLINKYEVIKVFKP